LLLLFLFFALTFGFNHCLLLFYYAVSFAVQPKEIRQTVIKERIKAAQHQQDACRRQRHNPNIDEVRRLYYRVPVGCNTLSICINGFRNLFGIFRKQWEYLRKSCAENYDFLNAQDYPEEVIIMEASVHTTREQNQRELANLRIEQSKNSSANEWEDCRFVSSFPVAMCGFFVYSNENKNYFLFYGLPSY
jgi:hypothetical protein